MKSGIMQEKILAPPPKRAPDGDDRQGAVGGLAWSLLRGMALVASVGTCVVVWKGHLSSILWLVPVGIGVLTLMLFVRYRKRRDALASGTAALGVLVSWFFQIGGMERASDWSMFLLMVGTIVFVLWAWF